MKLVLFKCDFCEMQSKIKSDKTGYVYEDGWIYVYGLDIKIKENLKFSMRDKHFCNINCFNQAVTKIVNNIKQHGGN